MRNRAKEVLVFSSSYQSIMAVSSASYIHMVQHLIEECIVFNMSKEECIEALSKHANIKPVITCTVWNELEKENKEFFELYTTCWRRRRSRSDRNQSQVVGVEGDETETRVQLRDHQFVHMKTRLDVSPSDSSSPADD
ncbi:hypothetical protein Dimus_007287 [Dionaea muscipula]